MLVQILGIAMFFFVLYALVVVTREIPQRLQLLDEKMEELQATLEEIKKAQQRREME